jgi:crotonobetainyl-CoA:carnitine CoA-transferase CaiB-like acyl-CoA transferase
MVAPATPKMWTDLCTLIGHPEATDPSVGARPGYIDDPALREVIDGAMDQWMAQHTADEAVAILQKLGIPSGVIRSIERVFAEETAKPDSRVLTKVHLPGNPKPVTVPGRSFRFPDETTEYKAAPALNADTFSVLAELGMAADQLSALESAGVIVKAS